jgi:hypothetical protein
MLLGPSQSLWLFSQTGVASTITKYTYVNLFQGLRTRIERHNTIVLQKSLSHIVHSPEYRK